MANHVHKQLRDAVVTRLTGLASTASRVYASRVWPLDEASLPALRVYLEGEDVLPTSVHSPVVLQRDVRLRIEAVAQANSALDDTLDQIGKEVEVALSSAVTLSGKSVTLEYQGAEMEFDTADISTGQRTMRLTAQIFTTNAAPDVPL